MLVDLYIAKDHLRVDGDDEDALIGAYISAAEDQAIQFIGRNVYPDTVPAEDLTGIVVNPSFVAAVLLITGSLYALREDTIAGVSLTKLPMGAHALLQPYRCGMGV